jgi:hypothetical protein
VLAASSKTMSRRPVEDAQEPFDGPKEQAGVWPTSTTPNARKAQARQALSPELGQAGMFQGE